MEAVCRRRTGTAEAGAVADAHGLHARFGFAPPDATYLERPPRADDLARGAQG